MDIGKEELGIDSLLSSHTFDDNQKYEIRLGVEHGLSVKDIQLYANPEFNLYQMEEIRLGFENGLKLEHIGVYADIKYTSNQMDWIR